MGQADHISNVMLQNTTGSSSRQHEIYLGTEEKYLLIIRLINSVLKFNLYLN